MKVILPQLNNSILLHKINHLLGGGPAYPPPLPITNPPHQPAIITTSGLSSTLHPPLNQQIFSSHPSNENVNPPHSTLLHSGSTNRQMDTMPLQGSGGRPVQIAPLLVPPGPRSAPLTAISIPLHNGPQYIPYENYQELYNYTQSLQQSINYLSGNLQNWKIESLVVMKTIVRN